MQTFSELSELFARSRYVALSAQCPRCGDRLIAPEVSALVDGGEIRHYWHCDSCDEESYTSFAIPAGGEE